MTSTMKPYLVSFLLLITLTVSTFQISCSQVSDKDSDESENGGTNGQTSLETQVSGAELLSKRLVLYKIASQEGDLAPFIARPESISAMGLPELAILMNEFWWDFDWEGARLQPLPSTKITELETEVFPLIATSIIEVDEENGWVKYSVGFDPLVLKAYVARAHSEWIPEEREVYLGHLFEDCFQVWCTQINGEWKIISHFSCEDDMSRPIPPDPPGLEQ